MSAVLGQVGGLYRSEYAGAAALTTTLYVPSYETIVNPERGFFHQPDDCGGADLAQVSKDDLEDYRGEAQGISLVRCIFYLDESPEVLPENQLTRFDEQAQAARDAGVKMVVRFAYGKTPNDAAPSVVQAHLSRLADTLRKNSDVILLVESGFVGSYGEGAYSQNFGDLLIGATPTAGQLNARKAVVDRLLKILPTSRKVVVRTPRMKRMMYGNEAPAPDPAAAAKARRVGHLNDCFLDGDNDGGTYRADEPNDPAMRTYPLPNDRAFVAHDTDLQPMGGETCRKVTPPRGACDSAVAELRKYHWSYLNLDWGSWIKAEWEPCMNQIQNRLGYRFRLVSTKSTPTVRQGGMLPFRLLVRNTGWAGAINRRPVVLVLRKRNPDVVRRFSLGTAADWKGRSKRIRACMVPISASMPLGKYKMLLKLPDARKDLKNRPRFSIQLANKDLWNAATGENDLLRTVTVQAQAGAAGARTARRAAPSCTSQAGPAD